MFKLGFLSLVKIPVSRYIVLQAYCTRHNKCAGGVMVTASHNPKEDNGYKVNTVQFP